MSDPPTRPRFYADEHVPSAVAKQLQRRDVDFLRCQDAGLQAADDLKHIRLAIDQGRILVTRDDDFFNLYKDRLEAGHSHPGLIFITKRNWRNIGLIVTTIHTIHETMTAQEAVNRTWYI